MTSARPSTGPLRGPAQDEVFSFRHEQSVLILSLRAQRACRRAHRCACSPLLRLLVLALLSVAATVGPVYAQTDEIQVYTGEINEPGQFSLTLHNNYTPIGRKEPAFPGGIVPDGAWNGVPEYAYGVTDWLELGGYFPLYSVTREGRFLIDGGKPRALFAVPHANERSFFYAVNFELSYNAHHWATTHVDAEVRPIIGGRIGPVDLIVNPIIDVPFTGFGALDFAPAERVAYNFSKTWALALEHYADYGAVRHFETADRQEQTLFAVVDYGGEPVNVEFGIGHGFTAASDALILKLILTRNF